MTLINKNTFFSLDIKIPDEHVHSESYLNDINDSIDQILYSMGASDTDLYKIYRKDGTRISVLFKAINRKRKGQLNKFCTRFLKDDIEFEAKGILKEDLMFSLAQAKTNPNYQIEAEQRDYDGSDIKVFENKANWYPWQIDLYNMIYNKDGSIKEPDPRAIISIVDFEGASGKSSFFKYIYLQDEEKNIGRASYGTAQQLRSAIIGQGVKKIYIIDLSRAKSRADAQEDLLSVLEDCKSGFILSPMYGQAKELIMAPPHIIVSSNYMFNTELLSKDRWHVYELKNKKLGTKNALVVKSSNLQKKEATTKKFRSIKK